MEWWGWLLLGWAVLAPVGAVALGRAIREAERRRHDLFDPTGEAGDVDVR